MTKVEPYKVADAHIAILGHTTLADLNGGMPRADFFNGFANRFLWAISERRKQLPSPHSPPEYLMNGFAARLRQAIEFGGTIGQVHRDSNANRLWELEYPRLSQGEPGVVGAVIGRAEPYVLRLSLVYALLESSPVIQEVHLRAALAVWDYCEKSARLIFGDPRRTNPTARRIYLELMQTPGGLDRTQISGLFRRHKSKTDIDEALESLRRAGMINENAQTTAGRPRTVYNGLPVPEL